MNTGHAHALFVHGHSPVHDLPAHAKLLALGVFVVAVVATPREAFWAFAVHALLIVITAHLAHLGVAFMAKRLLLEIPFVLFAVFLPLVGAGERIDVGGLSLSTEGLWGAWTIIAKGTLGLAASVILTAVTTVPDILIGLDRLGVPRLITGIAGFMVRYLDVIAGEMRRMRTAMISRGYSPRWVWQIKAYATSAGALFIRSYERGERVYFAMASRGFQGQMPRFGSASATSSDWTVALSPPLIAVTVALVAMALT